jgi:hypothetical protein
MRTNYILFAALCLMAGCAAPPPPAATYYDPVTGARTDVSENLLETEGQPREVIWLNAFRDFKGGGQGSYYLEVQYVAPADVGYLEIAPGQTLTLVLDGEPLKLESNGSINRRRDFRRENTDFVREGAFYPVKKHDLQKIASAKEVKVQIKGNKGLVERQFRPENFERIRAFVSRAAI